MALQREKEEGAGRVHALQQALGACQARMAELEAKGERKKAELKKLYRQLEEESGQAWAKVKVRTVGYPVIWAIEENSSNSVLNRIFSGN